LQTHKMLLPSDEVASVSASVSEAGSVEPKKKGGSKKKSEGGRGKPEAKAPGVKKAKKVTDGSSAKAPRAKKVKEATEGSAEPKAPKKVKKSTEGSAEPKAPRVRKAKKVAEGSASPTKRTTAFKTFPEDHPPADKQEVLNAIGELINAVDKDGRKFLGFETIGETTELRYLNQLLENPMAQPESRSVNRDSRTAYTPSSNPNYNPRVLTHEHEEEYEEVGILFEKMFEIHYESGLVLGVLTYLDEFQADEGLQKNLLQLAEYESGESKEARKVANYSKDWAVDYLKGWAPKLLECVLSIEQYEMDSDDADTEDWSIASSCGESNELLNKIEEFIQSLDAVSARMV
jgi:hypothetical protein